MTKKKWVFPSESRLGVYHTVRDIDGQIVCDCPDFRYQPKPCRHARLVLNGLAEDFPVEGPRIVETNISKPVLAADTVFIPFHDDSETVTLWSPDAEAFLVEVNSEVSAHTASYKFTETGSQELFVRSPDSNVPANYTLKVWSHGG